MFLGRRKHRGHAKEMAYLIERPMRRAEKAQALLAKQPPREVPPLPLNLKKVGNEAFKKGFIQGVKDFFQPRPYPFYEDTFGIMRKGFVEKPANDNGKRSPFSCGISFANRLEKRGFKRLGAGCFSIVYAKEKSDRVIKVGHSGDNWMNYILWGRSKGYEGKFTPRVYSYKWYEAGFYVAVMERLKRTVGQGNWKKDKDLVLFDLFQKGRTGNDYALSALGFLEKGADKFALDLKEAANDNGWGWDDHSGNFMVRADGSFVATDPINSRSNPVKTRIKLAA